ncbi:MAG: Lon protease-like protein [Alteromonadaceae bacterium]|jgi:Lon protease-like protein
MKKSNVTVPVFPLPIFLLPEGITRLRIFEPRYLKMVKIASQEQGFVLGLHTNEKQSPATQWGSWVDIINFDRGEDGILEIDVKCHALVEVLSLVENSDNLRFGDVSSMSHWSQGRAELPILQLAQSLQQVFENNEALNELYSDKLMKNSNWVIARWLELLPVNIDVKNTFVERYTVEDAKGFVQSIIYKET